MDSDENNNIENIDNIGFVFKVSDDIVYARGLLKAQMSEMVKFENIDNKKKELFGIVNYLDNEGVVGITVLGDASKITAQNIVSRTGKQTKVLGGYSVLGRVINPIGESIDGEGNIINAIELDIEINAPSIIERKPVRDL
jgi:F-type H+-transporting ATPase subunit alpha